FFSSRRRHTRSKRDWSSDVCSSDLPAPKVRSAGIGDRVGFFATRAILRLDSDLSVCQQAIKRALNAAGARTVDERYTSLKVLCQFVQALRQKREKSKDDVSHADDSTS